MADDRYRHLPVQPARFFTARLPRARSRSWLKADDTGAVLDASPSFAWAKGLAIEQVETWCRGRSIALKRMNGNIKNIVPYLQRG